MERQMLEIILIIVCCRKIGQIVETKGRTKIGYQVMLVGFWIGGEICGAIVGAVLDVGMREPGQRGFSCLAYICALVGAAVGAGIAFAIANGLTPIPRDDEFYRGPDDRFDIRRPEYRRGGADRGWPDAGPRLPADADQITDRPAQPPVERRDDDRVTE
jgi:hypothetical protein